MLALCIATVLCFVTLGQAAPLACEELVRPLDSLDPHHLEGKWALVTGSLKNATQLERFRTRESALILFTNANDTAEIFFKRIFKFSDSCKYLYSNISLEGSKFRMDAYNITVTFLHTSCVDCLVTRFDTDPNELRNMYVFSRRRELGEKEIEEIMAQSECLNLEPPAAMDPTKDFCPDQEDEKTEGQNA